MHQSRTVMHRCSRSVSFLKLSSGKEWIVSRPAMCADWIKTVALLLMLRPHPYGKRAPLWQISTHCHQQILKTPLKMLSFVLFGDLFSILCNLQTFFIVLALFVGCPGIHVKSGSSIDCTYYRSLWRTGLGLPVLVQRIRQTESCLEK